MPLTPSTRWRGRGSTWGCWTPPPAEQILRNQAAGKDIGLLANLRGYERWRKSEAASMLAAMEGSSGCLPVPTRSKSWCAGRACAPSTC